MLKSVSSITNAIGALNFKGTWDANANSPALASSVGTKGDYYVVGTAGTTTLNGISNWGVGDLATFNGSVWQRVEGGADLNGVNLSVSGTSTLSGLTASTALALNASKEIVSVTNTGSGNNVLATSPQIATPTLTGDVQMTTGNLVVGTSGKGIDFSADPSAPGMTSELLDDYEEGTFTPVIADASTGGNTGTAEFTFARYTRIGRMVYFNFNIVNANRTGLTAGNTLFVRGLPFAAGNWCNGFSNMTAVTNFTYAGTMVNGEILAGSTNFRFFDVKSATGATLLTVAAILSGSSNIYINGSYEV